MSVKAPLTETARLMHYLRQNYPLDHVHGYQNAPAVAAGMALRVTQDGHAGARLTGPQRRRIAHKRNRTLHRTGP